MKITKLTWAFLALGFLIISPQAKAAVFSDVASNHPHYEAINYLQENGIVEGYSDNTFRPEQRVNRAEALKIILLGSQVLVPEIQDQEIFPDVVHGVWYAKFVAKAKNLTIVKGDDTTGRFRPGDTVNLAEALKILLKTNNTKSLTPAGNPYADVPGDAWFGPYFEYAKQARLLDQSASENVFPATPVTRGLLAELMYRLATNTIVIADGEASYYGEKFHGRTTANGEVFDASGFTAAHRTYPFDTWLKVTNAENGKSVVVRVNDRGPYAGENRIIDLSKAAFESISPLSRGIINVEVEVTTAPSNGQSPSLPQPTADELNASRIHCPEIQSLSTLSASSYEQVTLDDSISNRFLLDEVLTLKGSTTSNQKEITAFVLDSNDQQTAFSSPISGGRFEVNVRFPKTGNFKLGLLPGDSGSSVVHPIQVLRNTCIEEVENSSLSPAPNLTLELSEGETIVDWEPNPAFNLYKLSFLQGSQHKSYILRDLDEWTPVYRDFESFQEGTVTASLRGANLSQDSVLQPSQLAWSSPSTQDFLATTHYEFSVTDEVELVSLTEDTVVKNNIRAVFRPKVDVRKEAAVILPNGKVQEIELTSSASTNTNSFDIDILPASNTSATASYKAAQTGLHFLEVNNAAGLAMINVPIYARNQFPLLPSVRDLSDQTPQNLSGSLSLLRTQMLNLVNDDRRRFNLPTLRLDTSLSQLAQFRSDDMVADSYFGHWDKQGRSANDLRLNYAIQTLVGENLAKDINLQLAQYGLMRSAIHRSNILSEDWTRVGFGITQEADGSYIVVQMFSSDPLDLSDLDGLRNTVLSEINEERSASLSLAGNLNGVAQSWSQRMVDEDFFDFVAGNGDALVDSIRDAGVNEALGTYLMGNSSFADALEQMKDNDALKDSKWKKLGVGVVQDNLGIIKITLIYTE